MIGGKIADRMFPSPIRFTNRRGWFVFTNFMGACICVAESVEDKVLVNMPLTSS